MRLNFCPILRHFCPKKALFLAILTQKIYVLDVIDQLTLAESLSMSGPAYSPDENYDVYDNNMLIEL